MDQHPAPAKRVAGRMNYQASGLLDFLSTAFHWNSLHPESLIVDLGGSQGHASARLASLFLIQARSLNRPLKVWNML